MAPLFVSLTGAKDNILMYGTMYYRIIVLGFFFSCWGLSSSALIRAEGNIRFAMMVTGIAVCINIAANPFFISVLGYGTAGSAWATNLSMCVYCCFNFIYFLKNRSGVEVRRISHRVKWDIISSVLSVGSSAMMMQVNSFIRQLILFRTLAFYGNEVQISFFAAIYRIFSFCLQKSMRWLKILGTGYLIVLFPPHRFPCI